MIALGFVAFALGSTLVRVRPAPEAWEKPVSGPVSRLGVHEGTQYRIEVPAAGNGGLVMYAHGYEGEGSGPGGMQRSPLASHLTSHGYAWAASSYRSRGYRPDWFIADTLAVREVFVSEVGPPRWTILHGQSMGGHVAIASLELHPGIFQGGLIECGIIDGVSIIDLNYAYRAAAEYFSGVTLMDAPGPQVLGERVNTVWLPLMGMPGAYTERGRRYDSVLKHLMGGDVPLRLRGLQSRYIANLVPPQENYATNLLHQAASTQHIRYRIDPGLASPRTR